MRVGFIGLGIMGAPMAANLVKAGFTLAVHDCVRERAAPLEALGARAAGSPAELAPMADLFITMLPDTPQVEAVLFGEGGLASALSPGSIVIDMSTIAPSATIEFARRLGERGVEMLDAPVSGGEPGARQGRLSIMVGGRRQIFERCLPVFEAMGSKIVYTGPNGHGQKTKLVNQVVGSLNLLAAVEGIRLARSAGLDLELTLEAVAGGAAGSWMWSNLGPKMAARDYAPGFMIKLHAKDLRLASELVSELGLETPGTRLCRELFEQAVARGLGELGNQGLIRLWEPS